MERSKKIRDNLQNTDKTVFKVIHNETDKISENNKYDKNLNGFVYQVSFPYVSSGMLRIYSINPETIKNTALPILSRFHKSDFNKVQNKIYASMINLSAFNIEYRIVLPDNTIKWLRSLAKPIRLEDGSFVWNGHVKDITQLKNEEETNQQTVDYEKNNELLNLVRIIYQNLNSSHEQFKKLYRKVDNTTDSSERQMIISYLKELSKQFAKEKAYINEIIKYKPIN